MEERRSISRWRYALSYEHVGEDPKCRNSMCSFNHMTKCPRCGNTNPEVLDFKDEKFEYSCKECLNKWSI